MKLSRLASNLKSPSKLFVPNDGRGCAVSFGFFARLVKEKWSPSPPSVNTFDIIPFFDCAAEVEPIAEMKQH